MNEPRQHTKRCSGCPESWATRGTSRPPSTAWGRWRRNRATTSGRGHCCEENLEVIEELEEEGDPATTAQEVPRFQPAGVPGDQRGGRLRSGNNPVGGKPGVGQGNGRRLSRRDNPRQPRAPGAAAAETTSGRAALAKRPWRSPTNSGARAWSSCPSAFVNLGLAALGLGEHERAMASFEEALVMSQEMGRKPQAIESLEGMASLAGPWERHRAARLWGAAEAAREVTGISPVTPGERALHEPYLASARSRLGEARGKKRWPRGGHVARRGRRVRPPKGTIRPSRRCPGRSHRPTRTAGQPHPPRAGGGGSRRQGPHQPPDLRPSSRSPSAPPATTSRRSSASWASTRGPRSPPGPPNAACSDRSRTRARLRVCGLAFPERWIEDPRSPDLRVLGPQHRVVVRAFD